MLLTRPRGEGSRAAGFPLTEKHYPPTETNDADAAWDDDDDGGEYDGSTPDMFRTEPSEANISRLLSALAQAWGEMPALETAELFTYVVFDPVHARGAAAEQREREMRSAASTGFALSIGGASASRSRAR